MQLVIMHKVKSGELSIDGALKQAKEDEKLLLDRQNRAEEEQFNFSVHKHNRYRWQKRVLQIDFSTKQLCSIEKGIIKRRLAFGAVRRCDDGPGSKFSVSFRGQHDYELEATSVEDKHKMIQLLNRIIHQNIYSETGEGNDDSLSLRDGVLVLYRGGLASCKWVRFEVKLHPDQLVLLPLQRGSPSSSEGPSSRPRSTVIHLSDGDTSVQNAPSQDAFTLVTYKDQYQFRVTVPDQTTSTVALSKERDAWVEAIENQCSKWRRRSKVADTLPERESLRNISIADEAENANAERETNGGLGVSDTIPGFPLVDYEVPDPASGGGGGALLSAGGTSQSRPSAPLPKCRIGKAAPPPQTPPTVPEAPPPGSGSAGGRPPSPPGIPAPPAPPAPPPPLPLKKKHSAKTRTKPFHWDVLGSDKMETSFWRQESSRSVEIDTLRLFEQFAVRNRAGPASVPESGQNIMLNEKIAHNFNIFLRSLPVEPRELKDKLFIVSEGDGGLSDEQIATLRRYVPTPEDIEMYKSHKGPVADLHIVDQYMLEMCNIPCLSSQLDLLLTLRELPETMSDLQPLINQKTRMCTELSNSRSFVSVLEYLLAIGNYLNGNAGKEKAEGIRLSSLAKLSQLRGRDTKYTLLHALVEQIMLQEAWLATFTQELAEFETVPGASIKGLTAEVDVLKNELQKVVEYSKKSKKGNSEHPKFSKDLKTVLEKFNTDLSALTKTCEEMKKGYATVLVKFGEPADQDSQELFGLICGFVHDFQRVRAEMMR
ncbi:uncharacterized protein [Brachionichthys hirsutus]|uniref:uncharacterized protein n=1 Tax=Brachionichthys hirsutus TaxID=412623 RepID=UPI00360487EE